MLLRSRNYAARLVISACLVLAGATAGCSGPHTLVRRDAAPVGALAWFEPTVPADVLALERWRSAVGAPLVRESASTLSAQPIEEITIVSWNVAVGDGDVLELIREHRARMSYEQPLILLLQEAYRRGPDVPRLVDPLSRFAAKLGAQENRDHDIAAIAEAAGLNAYYAPSMRNGDGLSNEDRGNAILSNLPLTDLAAIELPFERQRRVAIAATVSGRSTSGASWKLRLISAHLDNMVGPRRLWLVGGEHARARQARALVSYLDDEASAVLAGDFNTWFGFADQAFRETSRAFPQTRPTDRRPTFRSWLRLDHVFYRLPSGWSAEYERGSERYGSDHFPLIATIRLS